MISHRIGLPQICHVPRFVLRCSTAFSRSSVLSPQIRARGCQPLNRLGGPEGVSRSLLGFVLVLGPTLAGWAAPLPNPAISPDRS